MHYNSGPPHFWQQGPVLWKTSFSWTVVGERCGGEMFQAVMRAMGSGRWSFAHLPATHLLLWGLVPNRLWTSTGPWSRGWGPLHYKVLCFWKNHALVQLLASSNRMSYSGKPQSNTEAIMLWSMDAPSGLWDHIHTLNVLIGRSFLAWESTAFINISKRNETLKILRSTELKSPILITPNVPYAVYFFICCSYLWFPSVANMSWLLERPLEISRNKYVPSFSHPS